MPRLIELLGGPRDGERIWWDGRESIFFPVPPKLSISDIYTKEPSEIALKRIEYSFSHRDYARQIYFFEYRGYGV